MSQTRLGARRAQQSGTIAIALTIAVLGAIAYAGATGSWTTDDASSAPPSDRILASSEIPELAELARTEDECEHLGFSPRSRQARHARRPQARP